MTKVIFSSVGAILICIALAGTLPSCTKTNNITKTVIDTVIVKQKDTMLTASILTANSWKVEEIKGQVGNSYVYYQRGASGNTDALDNEYMTFNSNYTGIYTGNSGSQSSFTWNFTDATNRKIIWTWQYDAVTVIVVTWDNIYYKNGAINYRESYIWNGVDELASGSRIPR